MLMDDRVALHTAARRYCYDRLPALTPEYAARTYRDGGSGEGVDETNGTTAQWHVIPAILFGIEQVSPETYPTMEALRAHLLEIGQTATREYDGEDLDDDVGEDVVVWDDAEASSEDGADEEDEDEDLLADVFPVDEDDAESPEELALAVAEERTRFCSSIAHLSAAALRTVQPLFARHVLMPEETERLRQGLVRQWAIAPEEFAWWPIVGDAPPANVVAFNDVEFAAHVPLETLRAALAEHGVSRVYALDEYGPRNYALDLEAFVPVRESAGERYFTSEDLDWVIYLSHEASITLGGRPLLWLVRRVWPDWEEFLRTTHLPPFIPGLRGNTWYRTRIALRGAPRRIFAAAVQALSVALQHQPEVRNARAWWDGQDRQIVIELEHRGSTGEHASQVVDDALDAAIAGAIQGWTSYMPLVIDVQELR